MMLGTRSSQPGVYSLNWLTGTEDEFRGKAKARAALLGGLGAVAEPFGIGVFLVGVFVAL
jgi:hypothetical protein